MQSAHTSQHPANRSQQKFFHLLGLIWAKVFKKLRGRMLRNTWVHPKANIYSGTELIDCEVGRYTYIRYDSWGRNASIGAFCSISDHVFIGGEIHPMEWASTSPMFHNIKNSGNSVRFARHDVPSHPHTTIGNDVWLCHGAQIAAGVTIGNGAVVASGSIVTKDVPPYAVVAGIPAKVVRYRFDDDTINALEESHWWDLPEEKLHQVGEYIKNPMEFAKKCKSLWEEGTNA